MVQGSERHKNQPPMNTDFSSPLRFFIQFVASHRPAPSQDFYLRQLRHLRFQCFEPDET